MCVQDAYRGFVVGTIVSAIIVAFCAVIRPGGIDPPHTDAGGAMIVLFIIAAVMSLLYMVFHDRM
jgi:hypothetical protein